MTRRGRPAAILIGVDGQDWEDVLLQSDESFWKMIERRHRQRGTPLGKVRKRLEL